MANPRPVSSLVLCSVIRSLVAAVMLVLLAAPPALADDGKAPGDPTLLMTEIAITPTEGEFVEIYNPTGSPIDLGNVYLTDATYEPDGTFYYKIVTGANAGGGAYGDFHARFPANARIAPGEHQVVALAGSAGFLSVYGIEPTYELWEDGGVADDIPDMREALPGSIANQGGLTNSGEVVILYCWDGLSDLVQDLDYALWGDKAEWVDKTGVAIDGPDGDSTPSVYLADTAQAGQDVIDTIAHLYGNSWQRAATDEGTETATGGNGLTGHNETSENLSVTWIETLPSPNPGGGTTILVSEIAVTPSAGEFIEIYNPTAVAVDLSNFYLTDATNSATGAYYYKIVTGSNAGGGAGGDFFARFPAGASIGPGVFQTVAISGSAGFVAAYGVDPTYELYEDGTPDAIPDMREALTGSIAGQGDLADDGEVAILFLWDGNADLVADIDYAPWGDKAEAVDKTGVSIDGPDPDGTPSTYYADTAIADQDVISTVAHSSGESFLRIDPNEGLEAEAGGNGISGHDETSEDLSATWKVTSTPNPNQAPSLEIFEIQGAGESSPWDGQTITTLANVVTVKASNGFFMQTPAARDDLDPDTSNGVFVYTSTAPTVSVGNSVDVTGLVAEYNGLTEIGGSPQVTVVGTDTLPAAIEFTDTLPSPDPELPSCTLQFECWEGMRVHVATGTATGPTEDTGSDQMAEFYGVSRVGRAFREIGAEWPGLGGTIPTFDGNPEIFKVDPNRLGLANQLVASDSPFIASGVMAYESEAYELWPTALTVTPVTLPVAVRAATADELTIASLNSYQMYDTVDDPGDEPVISALTYQRRLTKHSMYIRQVLRAPDVIAVQEVEKLAVLDAMAAQILADDPSVSYTGYLVPGNIQGGVNIGFLVRDTFAVSAVTQLGKSETFDYGGYTYDVHDRPPLLLEGSFSAAGSTLEVAVLNNHVRSQIGLTTDPWVRQKRLEQAQSIAQKVQDFQTSAADTPLVVVGDYNAFQFTDGYVDVVGQICGDFEPTENLLSGPDLVDPNLRKQVMGSPAEERYSYVYRGSAQVFDHVLTSIAATPWVTGLEYGRGNADAPERYRVDDQTPMRAADHDAIVLYVTASGIFADGFESGDTSAWSSTVP